MSEEKKPEGKVDQTVDQAPAEEVKKTSEPAPETTGEPATEAAEAASSEGQAADKQAPAASETPVAADAAKSDAAAERAAARAARLAARAAAEPTGEPAPADPSAPAAADDEKAAKAQAAAEARAARASARAKTESAEPDAPKVPSPNQPLLDRLVEILKADVGEDAVVDAFINERDAHRPYVVIHSSRWLQAALTLRDHEELRCDYLRNLSGVDQETHLEVAYHLLSLTHKKEYCVKVKTDREQPSIPSVAPVWPTADWNEREVYDLFGIDFPGHPNLVRIMMPDDWVGHPLRKDYEPLDPEV
ncbi:NADH-quinone oxidoreductase subunit C [Paenibacillus sp. HWE-109]|uniref:NADH-quinone oxidoreductase subunit C n=1 Tax=Paenibacillus sp. HWE-109 TaxID=1306526 RepID=UPI001EE10A92|nr:NADH-quinone oxidoreductase subunit C [Paenibacillus sp. HWE-109]UKS26090.1 NADH-quinone oxidoreductase subunit C [Paenibacillus sp. HWE-109]